MRQIAGLCPLAGRSYEDSFEKITRVRISRQDAPLGADHGMYLKLPT